MWLPEDRAWAMALLHVEADTCPDCNTPWGQATDPEREFGYDAEVIRCHACTASAVRVKAFQDGGGSQHGIHVRVIERDPKGVPGG